MISKDLVVAVVLTFCLSFTLFSILPIGSQEPAEYDPWYDTTGPDDCPDGKIDMRDVGSAARMFGTNGDPTRAIKYAYEWNDKSHTPNLPIPPEVPNFWEMLTEIPNVGGYRYVSVNIVVSATPVSVRIDWAVVDYTTWEYGCEIRREYYDIAETGGQGWLELHWDRTYGNYMTIWVDNNSGEDLVEPTTYVEYYMSA